MGHSTSYWDRMVNKTEEAPCPLELTSGNAGKCQTIWGIKAKWKTVNFKCNKNAFEV